MHEASLNENNAYITLTFAQTGPSLIYNDFQKFIKRLRKKHETTEKKIRYYMCGEYGEKKQRPHYHAILFNHKFEDQVFYTKRAGNNLYVSAELEKLWPHGQHTIGAVTFQSAAYIARYVMKKITGDEATMHYASDIDKLTGEMTHRKPEFNHMSQSIGRDWLRLYWKEVALKGTVIINGKEVNAPKAYMKKIKNLDAYAEILQLRDQDAKARAHDNTPERLKDRETVALARLAQLKRNLE